ncbi:MAG: siderophore ABC transporter substrate-binding protein [Anaerobacillus sp.]|uniref:siderophore ABC transporter substrate-binding protein n=1 Tax=Anaerobacillus sp. TaxID=1872506 RepID=UPI00391A3064
MKNSLLLLLALLVTFVLAACGGQQTSGNESVEPVKEPETADEVVIEQPGELTFEHRLGEVTVSINPEKVIVFDFGVLDSLDKLGVEITALPKGTIPQYLSKYEDEKYENVGSLKEPDFEKIAEINPDLIIISGRQMDLYEEFAKLGPTLFMAVDNADFMKSFSSNLEVLGQIFSKEDLVASELVTINDAIAALQEKTSAAGNALVVLANEGNISAYGPGSRFGVLHETFGFAAADENIEVSTHGMNVSFEYILETDPDYLFVVDRNAVVGGEAAAKETIENELVQKTKAFQNGNIVYLDPEFWYISGAGLISIPEMIKAIEEAIQ